jgi:hypothetical protein
MIPEDDHEYSFAQKKMKYWGWGRGVGGVAYLF